MNATVAPNIGCRGRVRSTSTLPRIVPMPKAVLIAAQLAAPDSSVSAITGPSASTQGSASRWYAVNAGMNVHIHRRFATSAMPPFRSRQKWCSLACGRSWRTWSRSRNAALTANVAASMAIAVPGPSSAIRMPASVGPATMPTLRAMPSIALPCCRCCCVATIGTRPPSAGWKPASNVP